MKKQLRIGVVVTVYNVEPYIERCIESIVNQSYEELQIVLVNDGSSDKSGSICDEYAKKDKRIKAIHQSNQGVMRALYAGAEECVCDYITCVDGDDWIDKNTYMEMSFHLTNDLDIATFGAVRYYRDRDSQNTNDEFAEGLYAEDGIGNEIIPNMLWNHASNELYGIGASLCSKIVKKELFMSCIDRVKDLPIYYGQDVAIVYPMLCKAKSVFITHNHFYYHRQRENGEVASYIQDENFIGKLYMLYSFLQKEMGLNENIKKQIDMFFIESIKLKKEFYYPNIRDYLYMFPFRQVAVHSNIILYGAGNVGDTYYSQLKQTGYCHISGWIDKKPYIYQEKGVQGIDCLNSLQYDYVVIAIASSTAAEEVKQMLLSKGIRAESIIWTGK